MSKHFIWMVVGCTLPLLLIFLAPALGLRSDASLFIFILAMFACHLFMPMHHHEADENPGQNSKSFNPENHDHHI